MVSSAAISHDGQWVLAPVSVELEFDDPRGQRWSGVLEASGQALDAWPIDAHGAFRLHLPDGRTAAFTPTRQCGRDLGTTVVMFQGAEPLGQGGEA